MTDFLYPFIEADERDAGALLTDLAASAEAKARDSDALQASTLREQGAAIDAAASAMAERFALGGRLLVFGNGGSSTDAAGVAALFARPPRGAAVATLDLANDPAIVTALGNDVGFELVFSRQVMAHGRSGDVAIGISTSGTSRNVLVALEEAGRRRLLAVGLTGYGGGAMAGAGLDHCLVVHSDSVHRIQEAQAVLAFALWSAVQERLRAQGAVDG